jgi:hypothetical protein
MIISVWKPINKNYKISHYEIVDKTSLKVKEGKSNYKVIWLCDNPNCRTPMEKHSISACHLKKVKMCYDVQICRPCQCTGEGNGRYGDRRKWNDFFDEKKLIKLKDMYSNKWKGESNPSKMDYVKIKKNQLIINDESIKKMCNDKGFELVEFIKIDGKKSKFKVKCCNNHTSEKSYQSLQKGWGCKQCHYESTRLNLSDEELLKFDKYRKQVRYSTSKTYKIFKSVINPNNLINSKYEYHIDHKYSIYEGFKNNVDTKIISSKENLEMLHSLDNLRKNKTCSMTLEELLYKTKYLS